MVEKFKYFISDYRKVFFISAVLLIILLFLFFWLPGSWANTRVRESVYFDSKNKSYTDEEPGAWRVTKTSKWLERDKVRITFDIDSIMESKVQDVDLVLLLDNSASMLNEKIDKVKEDTYNLLEILLKNERNRVALITFNSESNILSGFTNNLEDLNRRIDTIKPAGQTNYYQAFVNLGAILNNYEKEENRDLVVLFITDGYPNIDTPNEISEYQALKEKYPFIMINAIQYEMGEKIAAPVSKISDKQYVAEIESLYNALYDATGIATSYDSFEITDYINSDYFYNLNKDNVTTEIGDVEINENSIKWNLGNHLRTGIKATMSFDISLKPEYVNQEIIINTNESTIINSQLNENQESVESTESPIVSNHFDVIYDANAPEGCSVDNVPATNNYYIFDTVEISKEKIECDNYQFIGWQVADEDIVKINDEYFQMPPRDVTIRGTWSSLSLAKSVVGEVNEVQTLYSIMKDASVIDNISSEYVSNESGIKFKQINSDTNGKGVYMRANTASDKYPLYYYRGDINNNNIIYANYCWKIIRTTDTGGVKIIYNGTPDSQGHCNNTGSKTTIGSTAFNSIYSPASQGYMYGTDDYQSVSIHKNVQMYNYSNINANYYYADEVIYDENTKKYSLVNPQTATGEADFKDLVGKYTFLSEKIDYTGDSVRYIAGVNGSRMYYVAINNDQVSISSDTNNYIYSRHFSKAIEQNVDGSYSLINPEQIRVNDWFSNYKNYDNYYVCEDGTTKCQVPYRILTSLDSITLLPVNILFGNSFTYENGEYILKDTQVVTDWHDYSQFDNHHYTCLNFDGKCSKVNYLTYTNRGLYATFSLNGVTLDNGISIEEVFAKYSENNFDSSAKKMVDTWYEKNILNSEFESYLEDTVYCNDRRLSDEQRLANGWNPNGGSIIKALSFYVLSNYSKSGDYIPIFTCEKNDSFSISSDIGNGKLKYPIGLITLDEALLSGATRNGGSTNRSSYLYNGTHWWTMTPDNSEQITNFYSLGYMVNYATQAPSFVRPVVSLKPGVRIASGTGDVNNPYILD